MVCGKGLRGVLKNALEGSLPLLAQLVSAFLPGLAFLLLALELVAAFLGEAVLFGLVLPPALLVFGLALCGFFWGLLLGCGSHNGRRVFLLMFCSLAAARRSWTGQLLSVQMGSVVPTRLPHRTMAGLRLRTVVPARHLGCHGPTQSHDRCRCGRLPASVLSGAVPVLNLDEFGMSGNFAVDVSVDLRVKARGVALHVGKESRIEFAAAGARDASSCGWVEGCVGVNVDALAVFNDLPLKHLGIGDIDDAGGNGKEFGKLCGTEAPRSRDDLESLRVGPNGDGLDEAVSADALSLFAQLGFIESAAGSSGGLVDGVDGDVLELAAVLHGALLERG